MNDSVLKMNFTEVFIEVNIDIDRLVFCTYIILQFSLVNKNTVYKKNGRPLTVVLSENCIFMRVTYGIEINNDTYLMGHPFPLRTLSSTLQRTQQDNQFQCSCKRNISCQKCLAFFVL